MNNSVAQYGMDFQSGQAMLTLSLKQIGRKKALETRSYPLGEFNMQPTLRELISRIVALEVEAFKQRQNSNLLVRALTQAQLLEAAQTGKISMGGAETVQEVNTVEAVQVALQAFEDGLYYAFYGEQQLERLTDTVALELNQELMFLRLVALAGG
jgi:phosphate starvation-inducible protein PhoH